MTISTTIRADGPFDGDGVIVNLDFEFKVFDDSEVQVLSRLDSSGVDTELTLGVDYTVTLNANQDVAPGGRVILTSALASGRTAFIVSQVSPLQASVFTNTGGFYPTVLNDSLDRLHALHLENREVNSRAVVTPVGETGNLALPPVANRVGKYLYFDVNGDITASDGTDAGTAIAAVFANLASTASGKGAWLVNWIHSLTGSVARLVGDRLRDTVSVKDFGAVGDGSTNDRAAIAAAISGARGRRILFPKGNYLINTDGGSLTLEEVELSGENILDGATGTIDQGVNLWITGTANSPFKIRRGTTVSGLGFYYPNQTDSATPTVYPATLAFDFTNGAVQFVNITRNVFYNSYRVCDIDNGSGGAVGHVEISGNYICGLNRGIYVRHNAEHIRIQHNNFTFGFWLAATEAGARAYMRAHATAIQADQSDGLEITDNLFYGYLNGILLSATSLCQFMNISLNKFDTVRYPVKATGSGNFTGTIIGNSFISYNNQDTTLQGRSIEISTTPAGRETITISGNNFLLATEDHIYTSGNSPSRDIVVTGNNFISWAAFKAAGTYGAINANGNSTNIQAANNYILGGNSLTYSYGIMGSFNVLGCSANFFESCQRPLSVTLSYCTGSGNASVGTGHTASDVVNATYITFGPNNFDKPNAKTGLQMPVAQLGNYANDAAAAGGGVPVGGFYRNGSTIMIRVA